ncbi:MAG: hypothetical protein FVQ85_08660 [Planctomycetes bacterium]|nr:hypothetical protein [Planctomycetota bacterium]
MKTHKKLATATVAVIVITSGMHCCNRNASTVKTTDVSGQAAVDDVAVSELVPLDIKLPRPMYISHRSANFRDFIPNLEPLSTKPRPPFLAPVGTKNVAFGKPVTCTDEDPIIGKLEMITDGDKEAAEGSFVELGFSFLQHITIDLEAEYNIYAIVFWHYHRDIHAYFDVILQAADDPGFTINVKTLFNNDHDNSAGFGIGKDKNYIETSEGKLIDAGGVRTRYIRLYSNGNDLDEFNHYVEVEVYGKAAK